jgi:putative transposase
MDIRLFNTMDAGFCVDCLEEVIKAYGRPEIFNSGQGSQLTSDGFAGVLIPKNDITIGMNEPKNRS